MSNATSALMLTNIQGDKVLKFTCSYTLPYHQVRRMLTPPDAATGIANVEDTIRRRSRSNMVRA